MKNETLQAEAYLYVNGEHRGVSLHPRNGMELSVGTTRHDLVTVEQAEAHAAAKVREALGEDARVPMTFERWYEDNAKHIEPADMKLWLEAAFEAGQGVVPTQHFRHLKSGGLYTFIAEGICERTLKPVAIYQAHRDGKVWVRESAEFFDGRFDIVKA